MARQLQSPLGGTSAEYVGWQLLSCLLGVFALGVTACGDDDDDGESAGQRAVSGDTLTIYSSLPLQGTSKGQSEAVISGERLALKQAGGKVGKYKINYVSLDDSTAQNPGTADEAQTAQNARKAVQDKTTIFYLGEFNSGGTKVSLPILNKANIPQISPSNTAVGSDHGRAGRRAGRAGQVLPGAEAHVRPRRAQGHDPGRRAGHHDEGGRLQVRPHLQRQDHLRRRPGPQRRVCGRGPSASRSRATTAPTRRRRTTARWRPGQGRLLRRLGRDGRELRPGVQGRGGRLPELQALRTGRRGRGRVHRSEGGRHPRRRGGTDEGDRGHARLGGVREAAASTKPRSSSRTTRRSTATRQPDPYAIYGYETMSLALDTLKAVGDKANDREAVRKQLLENTKGRDSARRYVRHRRERRHDAHRLRALHDRGRPADLREGDQGPGAR